METLPCTGFGGAGAGQSAQETQGGSEGPPSLKFGTAGPAVGGTGAQCHLRRGGAPLGGMAERYVGDTSCEKLPIPKGLQPQPGMGIAKLLVPNLDRG